MRGLMILSFIFCLIPGLRSSAAQTAGTSLFPQTKEQAVKEQSGDEKAPYPAVAGIDQDNEQRERMSRIGINTIVLEHRDEETAAYKNFKIKNTQAGITISKKGKRLLFVRNRSERWIGHFGLSNLLGAKGKQLIYFCGPDGNHGNSLFFIVDLSSARPRMIFSSEKYQVQGNLDVFFHLGVFDANRDGKMEIVQEADARQGDDCPVVSNSVVEVGFTYDNKKKEYVPLRGLTPYQRDWNRQYGEELKRANAAIKAGQAPDEQGCGYDQIAWTTAYSYIYAGKEKEGLRFLERNYYPATYDQAGTVRIDHKKRKKSIADIAAIIGDLRRGAKWDKLYGPYRAVYRK